MKKGKKFTNVVILFLSLLFGIFTGILTLAGFFYFNHYPEDFTESFVDTYPDSPIANLIIVLAVCIVAGLLTFFIEKHKKKEFLVHLLAGFLSFMTFGFLIFFVYKTRCEPVCDQMQLVLDAIFFKHGNYEDMLGYMRTFQQQYGLVFLEEIMMYIKEDYRILQYLNAFFAAGCVYAMYRVSDILFQNPAISLLTLFFTVTFVPVYFYTNFVYGEMPSLFFAMYATFFLLQFLEKSGEGIQFVNKKNWYLLTGTILFFTLAYISRTNLIILLIATALSLAVYAIRNRKYQAIILAGIILVLPLLVANGIRKSYEFRSGYEIGEPQPALGWIAMGMQVSDRGYGFCNDYANNTFNTLAGYNPDIANEIYKEEIAYRLDAFKKDPKSAFVFYRMKMMQQWNEGTFGSIVSTNAFIDEVPGETVGKIYSDVYGKYFNAFCNRYIVVVYSMFFLFSILSIVETIRNLIANQNKKSGQNAKITGKNMHYLFMIYLIGGFLFSLLWEAKPRYVFPYVYYNIPLAAAGLYLASAPIRQLMGRVSY